MTDTEVAPIQRERPDLTTLSAEQQDRVLDVIARHGWACGSCEQKEFKVGHALYLGFLFRREEQDAYMVALTCTNPRCGSPRTGLRLRESEFLTLPS